MRKWSRRCRLVVTSLWIGLKVLWCARHEIVGGLLDKVSLLELRDSVAVEIVLEELVFGR